jgi:predicted transcriptional regulator
MALDSGRDWPKLSARGRIAASVADDPPDLYRGHIMNRRNMAIAAQVTLETLSETQGETNEGTAYAALQALIGLQEFQAMLGILDRRGWIERDAGGIRHAIRITDAGRDAIGGGS